MQKPKLIITLELTGKEKLDEVIKKLQEKYKLHADADFSNIQLSLKEHTSALSRLKAKATDFGFAMNGVTAAIQAVVMTYNKIVKPVIDTAAEFEQLQLRLESLYGDTERAAAAFEKFREVAADTPATLKGVVEAGATLKAFGLEAEDTITAAADLAAYMGMDVVEAAAAMGRAFAGGVGAADILRERGVLNLIKSFKGIDDLTKLTLPEFREAMLSTFTDSAAGIAGSADRMSESYTGAVANMEDAIENLQAAIGSKLTPILGAAANAVAKLADRLSGTKSGIDAVKQSLIDQRVEFEKLVLTYEKLHHTQSRSKEENEKYQQTIKDLMEKYPNYLKGIDLEKSAWRDIAKALDTARGNLQKYINESIKKAVMDARAEDLAKTFKKLREAENELATLLAEFEAGTKSRTQISYGVTDPLSQHSSGMPRTVMIESGDARREKRLTKAIAKYKAEIQEINKEIVEMSNLIDSSVIAPKDEEKGEKAGSGSESSSGRLPGYNSSDDRKSRRAAADRELEEYDFVMEKLAEGMNKEIAAVMFRYQEKIQLYEPKRPSDAEKIEKFKAMRDDEVNQIKARYQEREEQEEEAHYERMRFYLEDYYSWKFNKIEEQAKKESLSEEWKRDQISQLDKEKGDWDKRELIAFEEEYAAEMGHLAELRELGLATYSDVAQKAQEYYETLLEIVRADGLITGAEQELLDVYEKRWQAAQLAVNRDSDTASYYETVKFHDERYYDWKRARIEEDVALMDITEEQKAIILKQNLDELQDEFDNFRFSKDIFGRMMDALDIPTAHQARIINTFQNLSKQLASIWQQLYANLASERDHALKQLEKRAKKEHKTEVWLAKEKEKVEEEYSEKQRQMKRVEQGRQISSAVSNTAEGITNALTLKPAWYAPVLASLVGALGAAQVAIIAKQKFWRGGLVTGKGTDTSDSNIVALSNNEYVIRASRVREVGVPFLDALNSGSFNVRKAVPPIAPRPTKTVTAPQKVVLVCDGRELAKAVTRGNRRIKST